MQGIKRHAFILPVLVMIFLVYLGFVTTGKGDLFAPAKHFYTEKYYDAQGESLLQGRLDVPLNCIGGEAWILDNKCYGYFGIAPSLPRIPLNRLMEGFWGRWNRLFILAYSFGTILLMYLFLVAAFTRGQGWPGGKEKLLVSLFVLVLGLGTSNLFLAASPVLYHEAMAASCFYGMAAYLMVLFFIRGKGFKFLGLAVFFALLTMNSRYMVGFGVVASICLVLVLRIPGAVSWLSFLRPAANWCQGILGLEIKSGSIGGVLVILVLTLCVFASALFVNYLKLGTVAGYPFQYYIRYMRNPEPFEKLKGKTFAANNLKLNLKYYFGVSGLVSKGEFPWFDVRNLYSEKLDPVETAGSSITNIDNTVSFPLTSPFLVVLCLGGAASLVSGKKHRFMRLFALSSLAGSLIILFFYYISHKYIHDFFPFVFFTGATGLSWFMDRSGKTYALCLALLTLLAGAGIFINLEVCLTQMRIFELVASR